MGNKNSFFVREVLYFFFNFSGRVSSTKQARRMFPTKICTWSQTQSTWVGSSLKATPRRLWFGPSASPRITSVWPVTFYTNSRRNKLKFSPIGILLPLNWWEKTHHFHFYYLDDLSSWASQLIPTGAELGSWPQSTKSKSYNCVYFSGWTLYYKTMKLYENISKARLKKEKRFVNGTNFWTNSF